MKRLIYEEKNNFYLEEFDERECKDNEVLIETLVMGLCGSDLHKFLKQTPQKSFLKTKVLGHEIVGKIKKVGKKCNQFKIGDRVVVNPFYVSDNESESLSLSLIKDIDIVGRNIEGGYSELVYVPQNCIVKLPENIKSEDGIFIDDIAVVLHGLHYSKELKKDVKRIAILGDGPLGILCYKIFLQKYKNVDIILFTKNNDKLKKINCKTDNYLNIKNYEETFDIVIEAVGGKQSDTLNNAINIANLNALILVFGVYEFGYMSELNIRTLFYKQITLKGINSYCNIYDDFFNAIKLLKEEKIEVNSLITNRINFYEADQYIKNYKNYKNNIKTIFEVKK